MMMMMMTTTTKTTTTTTTTTTMAMVYDVGNNERGFALCRFEPALVVSLVSSNEVRFECCKALVQLATLHRAPPLLFHGLQARA